MIGAPLNPPAFFNGGMSNLSNNRSVAGVLMSKRNINNIETSGSKRVLIVSEYHLIQTFIALTLRRLKLEEGIHFDCFVITELTSDQRNCLKKTFENVFCLNLRKSVIRRIPKVRFFSTLLGLKSVAANLPVYDCIHINFHHYYLALISGQLRKKCNKLFVTFYGSDFNNVEWYLHLFNARTIKISDCVFVVSNPSFLSLISKKYKLEERKIATDVLMPLMPSFETFATYLNENSTEQAKETLRIIKPVIVCGYSAAPIVRHEKIIDALHALKGKLGPYKILFPMAYGVNAEESRAMVNILLADSGLDYEILADYLPTESIQPLRLSADIFIHIQSRDQMSASMLEHLAAGSVVITGKWLPYDELEKRGVFFLRIDREDLLADALRTVLENLDDYKEKARVNRKIILDMMDWKNIKEKWERYYG